jgi:hypothetical protein
MIFFKGNHLVVTNKVIVLNREIIGMVKKERLKEVPQNEQQ